ncbi:hypothetical protein ACI50N_21840, partial [Escherichia coli]|uniref:hypothetical protein n=1 Tax=Escherichia coli TaxID=562 RepID=UPI0038CC02C2
FFCSLLAPSDAILFQEGVSVKLRLPHTSSVTGQTAKAVFEYRTEKHKIEVAAILFILKLP